MRIQAGTEEVILTLVLNAPSILPTPDFIRTPHLPATAAILHLDRERFSWTYHVIFVTYFDPSPVAPAGVFFTAGSSELPPASGLLFFPASRSSSWPGSWPQLQLPSSAGSESSTHSPKAPKQNRSEHAAARNDFANPATAKALLFFRVEVHTMRCQRPLATDRQQYTALGKIPCSRRDFTYT